VPPELVAALREYGPRLVPRADLLDAARTDRGVDPARLAEVARLGLVDAAVDTELGGLGLDEVALAELFTVAGEVAVPAAIRETAAVLVPLLARAGGMWARETLAGLRAGTVVGGGGGSLTAAAVRRANRLTIHAQPVWLGRDATVAAVVTPELAAAVELREPPTPLSGVDAGQGLAALSLDVEPGDRCVVLNGAEAAILWRRWQLLLLADALGCARSVLRRARDHAATRVQFGRPIATFQAVAHTLADMHVGVTAGESMLARTAFLLRDGDSVADEALAAAACWLPARARKVCEQGIQVHGGTGFTWEHGLHLPYRRVLAVQAGLGGRYGSAARVARTGVAG